MDSGLLWSMLARRSGWVILLPSGDTILPAQVIDMEARRNGPPVDLERDIVTVDKVAALLWVRYFQGGRDISLLIDMEDIAVSEENWLSVFTVSKIEEEVSNGLYGREGG